MIPMKKNYKYVLMDADGTFFDFEKAEFTAVNKVVDLLRFSDREYFIQTFLDINSQVWKDLEKGKITSDQVNKTRFTLLHGQLSKSYTLSKSPEELGESYLDYLCMGSYLLEGAREILEYLSEKYTLILATNGLARIQRSRLKEAELLPLFDSLAISQEIGYQKPMVPYYEKAMENYSYKKKELIMVGDSLFSDMAGADAFGIDSIWLNSHEILNDKIASPTYEIESLIDIKKLL